MYPPVNRTPLREIGINGRTKFAISAIWLFFAMRLAVIGIHQNESLEIALRNRLASITA